MKDMGYAWHLRAKMAEREMYATTDLQPLLAERGISLSREQTYRMVTGKPQRLSIATLVALCDILDCTPNDLIEPQIVEVTRRKAASGDEVIAEVRPIAGRRTTINRPGHAR